MCRDLELMEQFDSSMLYLNHYFLPRAWVQSSKDPIGKNFTPVREISWSPNRIEINLDQSDKTHLLVLSELNYPGWKVFVDGRERSILTQMGILRSVEILPGENVVEFIFRPVSLIWGIFIFSMTILLISGNLVMMDIAVDNKNNNRLGHYLTERRWVVVFALSIMLITTLPYFLGYSVEINDHNMPGVLLDLIFGVEDGNSYIAKALTGTFGAWLFRTPYTVIPQNGVIAFLPYFIIGKTGISARDA
jgi:hypothetical protein